ncbi:MAG: DUF3343 domain-containing protein [Desulfobulbus sp.]|jgi:hypothetical protein
MLAWLKERLGRGGKGKAADQGLFVFAHTSEVIRAEQVLKPRWPIRVMGPPPELRTGCDLVIVFPLLVELQLRRALEEAGIHPLETAPVTAPLLEPVSLLSSTDFGDYLMVRAANMKITVDRRDRRIVNISGGGCPDVPYLGKIMVGRTLDEAPCPRETGQTLCGYALHLAYEELRKQCP